VLGDFYGSDNSQREYQGIVIATISYGKVKTLLPKSQHDQ